MWPLAIKNKGAPPLSPQGGMIGFHSLPPGGVGGGCLGGMRGASFFTNEVRYFLCEAYFLYDVWMATIVVSLYVVAVQELVL